jgi:CxxC motif-containing protein (DUF1111 family)
MLDHRGRRTHLPTQMLLTLTLLIATSATAAPLGEPMRGLTAAELQRFDDGRTAFATVEGPEDGLGPVFNGTSCAGCHSVGAVGGGSEQVETRFGTITDGAFDDLAIFGGSLIQTTGIGAQGTCTFEGEVVPPEATIVAGRRTTPLFGLGLVDAVPDVELLALARLQARFHPATAGRANVVADVATGKRAVGRFGWKSQVPSLLVFSGDAYLNEMGVTTPMFPDENCPNGDCDSLACDPVPGVDDDLEDVRAFRDFMTMLAPPVPAPAPRDARRGSLLFDGLGCAACHVRTLVSGRSGIRAVAGRVFHPYSDFLLHDMGALGDGIAQNGAGAREMRTAPLWGSRLFTTYLHDGRAHSLEVAIAAHDGQGGASRDRFAALPPRRQAELIAFLKTL